MAEVLHRRGAARYYHYRPAPPAGGFRLRRDHQL